ncbi:pilus assembly PilX family protein [Marinobacter sp. 1Y8]
MTVYDEYRVLSSAGRTLGQQKGSALLVSLIMLLLLSLIAVAGMKSTIMQERMSSNLRDRDLAFQAAEAALRSAEQWLRVNPLTGFGSTTGLYDVNASGVPDWQSDPKATNGSIVAATNLGGVAAQPRYYIERINTFYPAGTETEAGVSVPPVVFFRITALGYGGSQETTVMLNSVYRTE